MKQADTIARFLFEKKAIRGEIVRLGKSFQMIMQQHVYPSVLRKLLGEALLAAVLLSDSIKYEGELTIQFQNDGPVKLLVAKCNHQYHIRGVVRFSPDITAQDIERGFGDGELVITVSQKNKLIQYQSIVPLERKSVPKALEYYFSQSEQLPTKFWMAVHKEYAVGGLLQAMPETDLSGREKFWQIAQAFTDKLDAKEVTQKSNEVLLPDLFSGEGVRLFEEKPVIFQCTCTIEKMENAIISMGEKEVWDILRTNREIDVTCEFCNHHYAFDQQRVENIFSK